MRGEVVAEFDIREGQVLTGPLFSGPMRVVTIRANGTDYVEEGFFDRLDPASGELRLIEIKGLAAATGSILLTPNERRVAEDRRDCYWLYVVTNCASAPELQEPIKDPARFPWHEVAKVQHYWLDVNAMTRPMEIRENEGHYGEKP